MDLFSRRNRCTGAFRLKSLPSDCSGSTFYNPEVIKTEAGAEREEGEKKGEEEKGRLRGHKVLAFVGGRWKMCFFFSLDDFVLIRCCNPEPEEQNGSVKE